jgi:hypothetical protein
MRGGEVSVRIVAGDVTTGKILATLPTTEDGGAWSTVLNRAGSVECTIPLRTLDPATLPSVLLATEPVHRYLAAVTDTGHVLEAGPIWAHDLDETTGHLRVGASGLWSLLNTRRAIPAPPWPNNRVQEAVLTWSSLSLGTIAKRLIAESETHTGGGLPIVLPADEAGADGRTYHGYESAMIGERLTQLCEVDGGPDLALQPRLTTDGTHIEWVLRTGTVADPLLHQVGADWQWDRGAVRSALRLLSVHVDASNMASRAWVFGAGSEEAQLIGYNATATLTDAGYPLTETDTARTDEGEQASLDAYAVALRGSSSRPWSTWDLEVSDGAEVSDGVPTLGAYRPGDWCQVSIPVGHEYLRPGAYRSRILAISGGLNRKVRLRLAPTLGGR